jgi:hypothetical protein
MKTVTLKIRGHIGQLTVEQLAEYCFDRIQLIEELKAGSYIDEHFRFNYQAIEKDIDFDYLSGLAENHPNTHIYNVSPLTNIENFLSNLFRNEQAYRTAYQAICKQLRDDAEELVQQAVKAVER